MKKLASLLMLIVLFLVSSFTGHAYEGKAVNVLAGVESYKIFYNTPNSKIIEKLRTYDLVIIEPQLYTKEQIDYIQSSGTIVMGYIGVMETPMWNQRRVKLLEPTDYYHKNGQRIHYPQWDSYYMDITKPHFQQVLLDEVQEQIVAKGFDGAFLDTVGNIDNEHFWTDKPQYYVQLNGLLTFLEELTTTYQELLYIQNWGMETIMHTHQYMDGFMWEGFNYNVVKKDEWAQNQISRLTRLQEETETRILTVSFETEKKSTKYAKKFGFAHYHEKKSYDEF
ncbi:putative glycoside hydrolase [Mangrovibacillus cuniculi]|uniref:Glycosyl hydrolase n=1 Tax=Mangrovibacillus cuniculi TaxID=2593652 RepID=A0A7S8CD03_9BACI|nr:putative glycoside hydrolase [Mangrovibacillus cuniculi]QPC47729.1 glycosyl hydrolase [Mangrovibacillus cuniculi]